MKQKVKLETIHCTFLKIVKLHPKDIKVFELENNICVK